MTGLAFIGGEAPTTQQCKIIAKKADYIAAADSGLIRAEEVGLIPDIIAGDMDSLDDESRLQKYPRESIRRYPVDKDQTDTEIVIQLLEERGCSEIILIGGGGGRLAHIFAIKALFEKQTLVSEWWTAHERVILLQENITQRLQVKKDAVLSIFPTGAAPWHLTSENLKWKLDNFAWTRDTFGISNVALEEEIIVHAIRGCFLIIIEY